LLRGKEIRLLQPNLNKLTIYVFTVVTFTTSRTFRGPKGEWESESLYGTDFSKEGEMMKKELTAQDVSV